GPLLMAPAAATVPVALRPARALGRTILAIVRAAGRMGLFGAQGVFALLMPPWFPSQWIRQLGAIGFLSLPVVGLTAIFTGAALALNIYTGGGRFNAEQIMPQIGALGVTRELGPVR